MDTSIRNKIALVLWVMALIVIVITVFTPIVGYNTPMPKNVQIKTIIKDTL